MEKQLTEAVPEGGVDGDAAVRQLDSATSQSPKPEEEDDGNGDIESGTLTNNRKLD